MDIKVLKRLEKRNQLQLTEEQETAFLEFWAKAEKETEAPTETETVAHVDNDYDGYDDYTGEVIEEIEPVEEETEAPLSVEDWYLG